MKFIKMHGLGNDFIILDLRYAGDLPAKDKIAALTNRKTGIGCDQFIAIMRAKTNKADCFMRIFNAPDASEVEACGNATRCVADILMKDKGVDEVVIETVAGYLNCTREEDGRITVDMGVPRLDWRDIPLAKECDTLNVQMAENSLPDGVAVNIGNPHIVFFLDENVEEYPVCEIGPIIETHALFPKKTNVEFCNIIDRSTIRMRVWERDAGETDACGSGACAVAVAAIRRGLAERKCRVILNGGTLDFYWREEDDHILMTGPATYVYKGELPL
ncbi:MAG: diaminopimelate epimerase [Alphaproteobacteria bacterium]